MQDGRTTRPRGRRETMSDRTKFVLDENDMPTSWYNIAPDLPGEQLPPPLNPQTDEPIGPADLALLDRTNPTLRSRRPSTTSRRASSASPPRQVPANGARPCRSPVRSTTWSARSTWWVSLTARSRTAAVSWRPTAPTSFRARRTSLRPDARACSPTLTRTVHWEWLSPRPLRTRSLARTRTTVWARF
jgi:hypothetical protein